MQELNSEVNFALHATFFYLILPLFFSLDLQLCSDDVPETCSPISVNPKLNADFKRGKNGTNTMFFLPPRKLNILCISCRHQCRDKKKKPCTMDILASSSYAAAETSESL